jgi:hypothetical protein
VHFCVPKRQFFLIFISFFDAEKEVGVKRRRYGAKYKADGVKQAVKGVEVHESWVQVRQYGANV